LVPSFQLSGGKKFKVTHEHVGPVFSDIEYMSLSSVAPPSMWTNDSRFDRNLAWMLFSDIFV
jgi:hypothetical protein